MREKGQLFLREELQLMTVEVMKELKKSPLKHHCNNCCRQNSPMVAKLVGRCLRRYRIFAQL